MGERLIKKNGKNILERYRRVGTRTKGSGIYEKELVDLSRQPEAPPNFEEGEGPFQSSFLQDSTENSSST